MGSAMAQAVSRRHLTAKARVRFRLSPRKICGGQCGTGTGFSPSISGFPCQFHSTGAPLHGRTKKKTNHLHNRVRSICCGALHHKKKSILTFKSLYSAHTEFVCSVSTSKQTATFALYNTNSLVFLTEMKSFYCAVRTGSLNKTVYATYLKGYQANGA
jgi:hypothetical protein